MSEIERVALSMGGFEVNSYVVHAPEGDVIVDAGAQPGTILASVRNSVAAVFVTHGHADHVDALNVVLSETDAPLYVHPDDASKTKTNVFEPLYDGEELEIAGETFLVLHTPGHSPGSVTFVVGAERGDQIVGDLILPGSVGRTDIAGASWEELEASLRKVMPLWKRETRLFCGHGPVLSAMEELASNPYLPPVIP